MNRIRSQPKEVWMAKMADRITNLHPPFPAHWDRAKIDFYRSEAVAIHTALAASSPYLSRRLEVFMAHCHEGDI
jgi:hypothetical protein